MTAAAAAVSESCVTAIWYGVHGFIVLLLLVALSCTDRGVRLQAHAAWYRFRASWLRGSGAPGYTTVAQPGAKSKRQPKGSGGLGAVGNTCFGGKRDAGKAAASSRRSAARHASEDEDEDEDEDEEAAVPPPPPKVAARSKAKPGRVATSNKRATRAAPARHADPEDDDEDDDEDEEAAGRPPQRPPKGRGKAARGERAAFIAPKKGGGGRRDIRSVSNDLEDEEDDD